MVALESQELFMKADIFEVTFWVSAGFPKGCGFNTCFQFSEVHQTRLSSLRSQGFFMINSLN